MSVYRLAGGMGDFLMGLGMVRSRLRLWPDEHVVVVVDHPHSMHLYSGLLASARFVDEVVETPAEFHPLTDPDDHRYFGDMNPEWRAEVERRHGPVVLDYGSGYGQYLSWTSSDENTPLPRLDATDFQLPPRPTERDEEYVCLQPFSTSKDETWTSFPRLALDLVWRFGVRVFLLGGPVDRDLMGECLKAENVESSKIVIPEGAALDAFSLVARSSFVFGTDSWAVHAAGLLGITSVMMADEAKMCQIIRDGYKHKLGGTIMNPKDHDWEDMMSDILNKRVLFKGRGVK